MCRSYWLVIVIILLGVGDVHALPADTGVVPRSLVLDQRWSYDNYTQLVVPTINWLQSTPLDSNTELRTRHDNFLMFWLQKNEQVVVHMPEYLLRFQNANRELYFIYTGGWIKHALETGDTTRIGNATAAVESVLQYYKADNGIAQNDYLDRLVEIEAEGKLPGLFDTADYASNTYLFLKQPAEKNNFKASENYFDFHFTGINFTNSKALRYRYMLTGYYDKWIYTDEERVTFPNLPPGSYKFVVQASILPGFEHNIEKAYSFSIAAPLYKQPWFVILLMCFAIAIVYVYIRRREQSLKHIAELKHEKVTFEYEYLKSQVSPHFLFNSLNTLTSLIEESPKSAVTYTQHLSDLYRNMLAFPDRNLIALSEELEILSDYLHIQKSRFGDALILKQEIPTRIAEEKRIIYLALQLLIENAIKHNVVSREHPLTISIVATEKELTVSNKVQPKVSSGKSSGMGLSNISKRYALATNKRIAYGMEGDFFVVRLPLL